MFATQTCYGCIDLLRMFVDMNADDGIATKIISEHTALRVGLTVVVDALVVADGEGGVNVLQFEYVQVQTVVVVITVLLTLRDVIIAALVSANAVPEEWNLIRADSSCRIYRIHFVHRQFQYIDAVATEAVGAVVEVSTGCLVNLVVPFEGLTVVHVVNEAVCVGI